MERGEGREERGAPLIRLLADRAFSLIRCSAFSLIPLIRFLASSLLTPNS
jgi:hypothetical protein